MQLLINIEHMGYLYLPSILTTRGLHFAISISLELFSQLFFVSIDVKMGFRPP